MSNLDPSPTESACGGVAVLDPAPTRQTLAPREVPLGGQRGIRVRRTLPHRDIRTIGAWCFADHYGPVDLSAAAGQGLDSGGTGGTRRTGGMVVPPHPHIGLQTVSWLLAGEIEHRDSVGGHAVVRPGQLSLMTAGAGIAHSEYSRAGSGRLFGVQLWVALTEAHRGQPPHFDHHPDLPAVQDGPLRATVMMGSLAGAASLATAYSPLLGAEIHIPPGGPVRVPLEREFEYGVLAADGTAAVDGAPVGFGSLHYLGWGARETTLSSEEGAVVLLLGGEPLAEHLLMWWNFVGRGHDEIAAAREDWEAGRFAPVVGDDRPRLPAPPLPGVRLKPRPGHLG